MHSRGDEMRRKYLYRVGNSAGVDGALYRNCRREKQRVNR